MAHALRNIVHKNTAISDNELDELESLDCFDNYWDNDLYEFHGNYILTDDPAVLDEAVYQMCCGIVTRSYVLSSGREIFFAFDYGH